MVRLNLVLEDRDFRALVLLAERERMLPGTAAKMRLMRSVDSELKRLHEAGELEGLRQGELFTSKKTGGKK